MVDRFIDLLIGADMVQEDRTPIGTLLTIVKYEFYQHLPDTNEDTDKDTNRTLPRTLTGHQQGTNNNDNNELIMSNNENKITPAPTCEGVAI